MNQKCVLTWYTALGGSVFMCEKISRNTFQEEDNNFKRLEVEKSIVTKYKRTTMYLEQ